MSDQTLDESAGCPFCDIVAGRAPGAILEDWGDGIILVPLDPVTDGHVLAVPKRHVRDAIENPMITAGTMVLASRWAERHESANILTSIGRAATQSVFHLHIHVVPRRPGDGLPLPWTPQQEATS